MKTDTAGCINHISKRIHKNKNLTVLPKRKIKTKQEFGGI